MNYLDYNRILYAEISNYLKNKHEFVSKDLFLGILAACRLNYTGTSLSKACRLASNGMTSSHIDHKIILKYAKPIMIIANDKLKTAETQ